jgi:hypothetical protein
VIAQLVRFVLLTVAVMVLIYGALDLARALLRWGFTRPVSVCAGGRLAYWHAGQAAWCHTDSGRRCDHSDADTAAAADLEALLRAVTPSE